MKRRTVLKRIGAVGAITAGIGTSTATAKPFDGVDVRLDVSDVSGTVTLGSLVDGDAEAYLGDEFKASLPDSVDPVDVTLQISAGADEIGTANMSPDCPVVICCPGKCPSECSYCVCRSWGCN